MRMIKQTYSAFVNGPANTRKWHLSTLPFSWPSGLRDYGSVNPCMLQLLITHLTEGTTCAQLIISRNCDPSRSLQIGIAVPGQAVNARHHECQPSHPRKQTAHQYNCWHRTPSIPPHSISAIQRPPLMSRLLLRHSLAVYPAIFDTD
jgi:hypothetical protein